MKKLSIAACLLTLALAVPVATTSGYAQRQPGLQDRQGGRAGPEAAQRNPREVDIQGQRNQRRGRGEDRIPGDRRGLNRPPLGRLGNRRGQLNRNQRQRLQQEVMRAIGLTQDQHLRMAGIRRNYDEELIATGRRVREAKRGLDRAIMAEQFDEAQFSARAEELARAQADLVRLQARLRAEVRGVLTTEQVIRFNELERKLRREQRERRLNETKQEN
jgi:Spy/CpxP family protein refolding chaperone